MIIPIIAVDYYKGKIVNLIQGDVTEQNFINITMKEILNKMYSLNINHMHIIDIEGAITGSHTMYYYIRKLVLDNPNIKFQVGGGIRSHYLIKKYCEINVDVIISTAFLNNEISINDEYKNNVMLALDFKSGIVKTNGWTRDSQLSVQEAINRAKGEGLDNIILTNILNDGIKVHEQDEALKFIREYPEIRFTISGGINADNVCIYEHSGIERVIIGRWFYEEFNKFEEFINNNMIKRLKFNEYGLIPTIISGRDDKIFMLGYSNMESIKQSMKSGVVFLYSRTKGELWKKGKTSNNILKLQEIICDCDYDSLLFKVDNSEFRCHLGDPSCFSNPIKFFMKSKLSNENDQFIYKLYNLIKSKKEKKKWNNNSYTEFLLNNTKSLSKKIIEEATEVILSYKSSDSEELKQELSDLFYHLLVLMVSKGISLDDVEGILKKRNRGANGD